MNMKKLSMTVTLALASTVAAADYRGEVAASYTKIEKTDQHDVSGEFHFAPVATNAHPLAEAAFLERSNNISLAYQQTENHYLDTQKLTGRLEFYVPDLRLYVAPFYTDASSETKNRWLVSELGLQLAPNIKRSNYDWGVAIGLTPMEGFRVSTVWSDKVDYELNFDVKYVLKLANDHAINLEFGFFDAPTGGDDYVSAAVDYYLDRTFSIGLQVEDQLDSSVKIRTRKFFAENFSAFASYLNSDDYDAWEIGASLRF
jgi:hypothetical protein